MKPIVDCPGLNQLARAIELCDEILASHTQAKIISLKEHRFIKELRAELIEEFRRLSRKMLFG